MRELEVIGQTAFQRPYQLSDFDACPSFFCHVEIRDKVVFILQKLVSIDGGGFR
jgi:hypothetical protein